MENMLVRIPAGPYKFGREREIINLPEFWISRTPITNTEYARFVTANGYTLPAHWGGDSFPSELADHPVTYVSWHDAVAYAEWLGVRLPTDIEWEKAARGSDGRTYPWGDWGKGFCNTIEAGVGGTTPVDRYSPHGNSPYGCADMAGNVLEWTATIDGKYRTICGGAYNHNRTLAACAFRVRHIPGYRYRNIGFRIASDRQI